MSKGPGRRQRRILKLLNNAPDHRLSRAEVEAELVEGPFDSSNTLRAIRGLVREGCVIFDDRHDKADAVVSLPPEPRLLSDAEVFAIISNETTNTRTHEVEGESDVERSGQVTKEDSETVIRSSRRTPRTG